VADEPTRLREIDLFRAVAILMVIGFHYCTRWAPPLFETTLYPYGDYFTDNFLFRHGHLGVDFFFIISGFVIALTLENCRSAAEFFARRAARLMPAMIACSLLTIIVVKVFVSVPYFQNEAHFWNLVPSWTFTNPSIWKLLLPTTSYVDGVYWTLTVEAKFYIWAACIYFVLKKENFARNMFIFCVATTIAYIIGGVMQNKPLQSLEYIVFGRYAILFASGVLFRQIQKAPADFGRLGPLVVICLVVEVTRSALVPEGHNSFIAITALKMAFFLAFWFLSIGWFAPKTPLIDFTVRIGLASYPLYLLHQNIGVGLMNRSIGAQNSLVVFAVVVGICAVMIGVSMWVHKMVEQPGKRLILSFLINQPQADRRLRSAM
jgi:peptidoglycan/LPS O-acetylase OafA/YrhL